MGNVVLYSRRSTGKQDHSFDLQTRDMHRWCVERGHAVVGSYQDTASRVSGFEDRPGLADALGAVAAHEASILLVWRWDRLGGDHVVTALVERELARTGARVEMVGGIGGGYGPEAQLVRDILTSVARFERSMIQARARAQARSRKARGLNMGTPSFGYVAGPDGALEPHPEEQRALARMKALQAQGAGPTAIARALDAEGYPPRGKRWWPRTVRTLLAA